MDRRSKHFCSIAVLCVTFTWQIVETRDQITSDRRSKINVPDEIVFGAFHSFLVKSKWMLATFMRWMRNNNLEIRIVGSSCRHNNVALLDDADN